MNNVKHFFAVFSILLALANSPQTFAQTDPVETEETVDLELGVVDTLQYGRNYGRNGNMSQLDVSFTAAELNHRLSWQAFDIERNEMLIFLNGEQIRTALTTTANRLGSVDEITVLAADLEVGVNVLSFRVSGGDETWGVTNLSVNSIEANVDGEGATNILLDAPDQDGGAFGGARSTDFTFDFSPRGIFYGETISFSFDSYVAIGAVNGFDVSLNGRVVMRVSNYRGQATFIPQTVSLDKSELLDGQNTFTIEVVTPRGGSFADAGFANVEVLSTSVPLLDVSVTQVSVNEVDSDNSAVELQAIISNLGAKISPLNTLTFFVSNSEDQSRPITVASSPVGAISGGASLSVVRAVGVSQLRPGRYLWACIDRVAEDLVVANDCSPVVMLARTDSVTSPIIMLLLDDEL